MNVRSWFDSQQLWEIFLFSQASTLPLESIQPSI